MTDLTDDMKTFLRPTPGQAVAGPDRPGCRGQPLRGRGVAPDAAKKRRALPPRRFAARRGPAPEGLSARDRHRRSGAARTGRGCACSKRSAGRASAGGAPPWSPSPADPGAGPAARAAGADTFIEKPLPPLGNLQAALLSLLPETARRSGPRDLPGWVPAFDARALAHDLAHVADLLYSPDLDGSTEYIAGFAAGLGRCSGDSRLAFCAERLRAALETGQPCGQKLAMLAGVVRKRLEEAALQGHATSPRGRTGHQLVPVRPHFGRISG